MVKLFYYIIWICLLDGSVQLSKPTDDSYVAAVLEYQGRTNTAANLQNYLQYIQEAAEQDADIVVFPELTLNIREPIEVLEFGVPAFYPDRYHEVLVAISEAAIQYSIYVVINIEERVNCTNPNILGEICPEQKIYLFNTNLVFDRNGAMIDRYRKINLFGEFTRTPALQPVLGVFTTDFGVTFGHFICFDLKFQVPGMQMVDKMKITDIIFPTMWYSELPYLTAVQIQEAFAYTMNVNLLAAGANNVRVGSAGSGIFSGKAGALVSTMPGRPTSKLLIARVPKTPGQVTATVPGPIYNDPIDYDTLFLMIDPSLPSHVTRALMPGVQEFELVDREVSCQFKIEVDVKQTGNNSMRYQYRAGVFSGVRTYSGLASGGVRLCSVFACTGDTINTCGTRFPQYSEGSTASFKELSITATVSTPVIENIAQARSSVYFPVSADVSIMPLKPDHYEYLENKNGNLTFYTLTLKTLSTDLYSFAIWGRSFHTDGNPPDPPMVEVFPEETPDIEPEEEKPEVDTEVNPGLDQPNSNFSASNIANVILLKCIVLFHTFSILKKLGYICLSLFLYTTIVLDKSWCNTQVCNISCARDCVRVKK